MSWQEYKEKFGRKFPRLEKDIMADVAIIGGGITGVLCAYRLVKAGKKVVLVEKKELASYATMATTAFITEVIDSDLPEIRSIFSEKIAKDVRNSSRQAIDEFQKIINQEKIKCEFIRCSNFEYASNKKQFEGLEEDYKFYKKYKFPASLHKNGGDLNFDNYGYLEIPDQAKFHVIKFLYGLVEKIIEEGGVIYENTEALKIEGEESIIVRTKGGDIAATDVIMATYKPIQNTKTHLKKGMYRSYVFKAEIPKDTFEEALYEDNGNPYTYFRVDKEEENDVLIFGGEDHKDIFGKIPRKKSFDALKDNLKKLMRGRPYKIVGKWDGPILEPSDGLPLIGEIKPHHYVATAFSGNGMTYSMISSMLLSDLILGKKNEWTEAYDPKRSLMHPKRLATKAKDYVAEFFSGVFKNMLS